MSTKEEKDKTNGMELLDNVTHRISIIVVILGIVLSFLGSISMIPFYKELIGTSSTSTVFIQSLLVILGTISLFSAFCVVIVIIRLPYLIARAIQAIVEVFQTSVIDCYKKSKEEIIKNSKRLTFYFVLIYFLVNVIGSITYIVRSYKYAMNSIKIPAITEFSEFVVKHVDIYLPGVLYRFL